MRKLAELKDGKRKVGGVKRWKVKSRLSQISEIIKENGGKLLERKFGG